MNVESKTEENRIQKNNRIRKTMNATKNTRKNQRCRVYEVKITVNKLSCEKKAHINRLFLEGKWLWNYTLGQKDVFSAERCPKSVLVNTIGGFADRGLYALGSQMKQDIVDSVKTATKILATSKKKGEKVGRIKFRKFCNSIPLRQYGVTYRIDFVENTISIQGLNKPLKVRGLAQIPQDVDIANARLVRKSSGLYFHITTYSKEEKRELTGLIGSLDFGIKKSVTFNSGRIVDIRVSYSDKLKADQRKMNRLYHRNGKTKNHMKRVKRIQNDYEKLRNKGRDEANKLVHEILASYDVFAIQDDKFFTWRKGDRGRIIQQSAIGRVKAKLKDSSQTIVVPHSFPSTQRCPVCGKDTYHLLSKRDYDCSFCGYHHASRDQKSAIMILMEALKQNVCAERTAKSPAQATASIDADASASFAYKLSPIEEYYFLGKQEAHLLGSSRNRCSILCSGGYWLPAVSRSLAAGCITGVAGVAGVASIARTVPAAGIACAAAIVSPSEQGAEQRIDQTLG